HTFSCNSLFYNLFFPFLATVAILLFLVSLVLGPWAHQLNGYYCSAILKLTESPPLLLKTFYIERVPQWLTALVMVLLLGAAVGCKIKERRDRFGIPDSPLFNHL